MEPTRISLTLDTTAIWMDETPDPQSWRPLNVEIWRLSKSFLTMVLTFLLRFLATLTVTDTLISINWPLNAEQ